MNVVFFAGVPDPFDAWPDFDREDAMDEGA